jgi:hypothetical protein
MAVNAALGVGTGSAPVSYNNVTGVWLCIKNTTSSALTLTNLFGYSVELVAGDTYTDLFPASIITDLEAGQIGFTYPQPLTSTASPIQAAEHTTYFVDSSGGAITINVPISEAPIFADATGEVYGNGWTRFTVIDVGGDVATNAISVYDPSGQFGMASELPAYTAKSVASATYTSTTGILAVTFAVAPLGAGVGAELDGVNLTFSGFTCSAGSAADVSGTFPIVSTGTNGTVINVQAAKALGTITINNSTGTLAAGGGNSSINLNTNYGGWHIVNANDIQGNAQSGIISSGVNTGNGLGVGAYTISQAVSGYNYLNVGRVQVQAFTWLPIIDYLLGNTAVEPQVQNYGSVEGGMEGGLESLPPIPETGAALVTPIYSRYGTAGAAAQPLYPTSVNESTVQITTPEIQETEYVAVVTPPKNYGAQPQGPYAVVVSANIVFAPPINNSAGT